MPDFGIFRGFNEKLFGDKLFAGQLPTQLGLIGSENAVKTDPNAQLFITAAGITDANQISAIDKLVKDLKGLGIWTKFTAIYPMVGGSAFNHKFNLKDPRDLDAAFRLNFTSGWTHSTNGATPNGTSAYANTFINSIDLNTSSNHLSVYGGTSNVLRIFYNMGAKDNLFLEIGSYFLSRNLNIQLFQGGQTNNSGFILATRSSSNLTKLFRNNTQLQSSTATTTANTSSVIIFGARNDATFPIITPVNYGAGEIRFKSVGEGLSDTEASNFYTAVQEFQTTLSRNV
jgi:hypothetical protein